MAQRVHQVSCVLASTFLLAACSGSDGSPSVVAAGAGGGSATTTTGDGSATTAATSGNDATQTELGTSTTGGVATTSGDDGTLTPDQVCAGVELEPEPVTMEVPMEITTTTEVEVPEPVAIYIVLDNSGSMDDGGGNQGGGNQGGGNSKWEQAVDALTQFVNDPASEGVDVGIQYFHPQPGGGNVDECAGAAHAEPAVGVAPLPDNAQNIVDSLDSTGPDDDTPTVGALTGGIDFCGAFQAQNPDEQCLVVLVTDGQPNACGLSSDCGGGNPGGGGNDCVDPNSQAVLTPIAAAGFTGGVTTFTVGMEGVTADGFDLLDAIAQAGGSDCTPGTVGDEACDVSATGGAGLLEALNAIRDTVLVTETVTETTTEVVTTISTVPCQFSVPLAPAGETLDPTLVNVTIDLPGGAATPLGQVASAAECSNAGGWYYDNPTAPSTIGLCPDTCTQVTGAADVAVKVELGCETRTVVR